MDKKESKKVFKNSKYLDNFFNFIKVTVFFVMLMMANEIFLKKVFVEYFDFLRMIDHLLAGVYIPIAVYFILNNIVIGSVYYITWCTYWELKQLLERGFFQTEQYLFDIMGVVIAVIFVCIWCKKRKKSIV